MELDEILEHGEVIIDSNNSALYERMKRVEGIPNEEANCHGTVAHLMGIKDQVLLYWQRMLKIPEVREKASSSNCIEYSGNGNPGFVGPLPMTLFLFQSREAAEIKKREAIGKIISFTLEVAECDGYRGLRHTGVYLGEYYGMEFMFHKEGCGGIPEVSSVSEYVRMYYSKEVFERYVERRRGFPVRFFETLGARAV